MKKTFLEPELSVCTFAAMTVGVSIPNVDENENGDGVIDGDGSEPIE